MMNYQTENIIDRFLAKYKVSVDDTKFWFEGTIPHLTIDGKLLPLGTINIKTADGDVKISGEDIYRKYFSDMIYNEFTAKLYGLDIRTVERIEEEKKRIGLIEYKISNEPKVEDIFSPDAMKLRKGFSYTTDFQIGKTVDDSCWCVRFWLKVEDDTHCHTIYFTNEPTTEQIIRADRLRELEYQLRWEQLRQPEYFVCRSCNHKTFWLDTADDIFDCADYAKERWCGSC